MRKLTKALVTALLGVVLVWGISLAQNKPQKTDQPNRPPRPDNREDMGRRPEPPRPGGPDGMMDNPKVQEELKRHGEVMKGLFEQIKALHEKIRKELESKIGGPGKKGVIEPGDINGNKPDQPNRPNKPDNPGKNGRPQPPPEQGNTEEPGTLPPGQPGTPPEGQGPGGPPQLPPPNEEVTKILEPYRAEAQQIADKIVSELVTHQQNLLQIVTSEKENIKNALTEKILLPPPPPPRQGKQGKNGREQRPDRPDRPDRGGRQEPPDRPDRPDRPDQPDNPDDSDR